LHRQQGVCAMNEAVSLDSHSPDQTSLDQSALPTNFPDPDSDQMLNQNRDSVTGSGPFLTSSGFEEHSPYCDHESDVSDAWSLCSDCYDDCALTDKLSVWALNYNIPKDAVSALLHISNPHVPGLPLDALTLLKTADVSKYNAKVITHGSYCHFGVSNGMKKLVDSGLQISSGSDDDI